MIEAVRTGKPVSIVEFQELTENDMEFSFQLNEAKKAYNREQPKVYRNGTGKRWSKKKDKVDFTKIEFEHDSDYQALTEEEEELLNALQNS